MTHHRTALRHRLATGALAALALAAPRAARAQEPTTTVVGLVRDSTGKPIPGVNVDVGGTTLHARTDEGGGFRLAPVAAGTTTLFFRRLGFSPTRTQVTLRASRIDSLVITLVMEPVKLAGVVVEEEQMTRSKRILAGFWDRRARGFGAYLTRDEVEDRHAQNFAELARMVPSAQVLNVNGRNTIRFRRMAGRRDCPPQYWVDGLPIERAEADEFHPEDVEALEFYAGPATLPAQFAPRPNSYTCGAVVIWTRVP